MSYQLWSGREGRPTLNLEPWTLNPMAQPSIDNHYYFLNNLDPLTFV
jgi:hypothetical protein